MFNIERVSSDGKSADELIKSIFIHCDSLVIPVLIVGDGWMMARCGHS